MFVYDQLSGNLLLDGVAFAGFSPLAPSLDMSGDWMLVSIDDGDVITLKRAGKELDTDPPQPRITRPDSDYQQNGGIIFTRSIRREIWETGEREMRIVSGWEITEEEEVAS